MLRFRRSRWGKCWANGVLAPPGVSGWGGDGVCGVFTVTRLPARWWIGHPSIPPSHSFINPTQACSVHTEAAHGSCQHARPPPECSLAGRLRCPEAELAERLLDVGWDTASFGNLPVRANTVEEVKASLAVHS